MTTEFPIRIGQWEVVRQGMQSRSKHYQISKKRLANTREDRGRVCSDWLLHLSGKEWVDIDDFARAWVMACRMHRVRIDRIDVEASVAIARWQSGRGRAFKAELDRQYSGTYGIPLSALRDVDRSDAMKAWREANPRP
jgi:hypothetical protein